MPNMDKFAVILQFASRWMEWRLGESVIEMPVGDLRVKVRRRDWVGAEEILIRGEYDFLKPLFAPDSSPSIIDLGANVGLFSARMLSFWPSAQILAVEPVQECHDMLTGSARESRRAWRTLRAAVTGSGSSARLTVNTASTQSRVAPTGSVIVPAVRLRSLLTGGFAFPDLLKMDIEGAEFDCLASDPEVLTRISHLVIECHPDFVDYAGVLAILRAHFVSIIEVDGRRSAKPLLYCSNSVVEQTSPQLAASMCP